MLFYVLELYFFLVLFFMKLHFICILYSFPTTISELLFALEGISTH